MLGSVITSVLFGIAGNPHFCIIGMLATKVQFLLVTYHVGLFVGVASYITYHPPLIPENDSIELGWANSSIFLLSLSALIMEFQRHNLRYESKIALLMESVAAHSATLEIQKDQIEKQAQELQFSNQVLKKEVQEKEVAQLQLITSNEELKHYAYVASHDL